MKIKYCILLPLVLSLASCNKKCNVFYAKYEISDNCYALDYLLDRCDIYCLLSFDAPVGKSFSSGAGYRYTKYSVTVREKYKGDADVKYVCLVYDQDGCYKTDIDREIELGKLYTAYLNYSNKLESYELSSHCPDSLVLYDA